jgi:hypothetical protein
MRFKLTILLLALNAALAGFIFYLDKSQSTRSLQDASSRLILNADFVQGLDRLQIISKGISQPWELRKSESGWTVASPITWKANPYAVEQLLFQLRRLAWESRFPVSELADSRQTLASYNLEDPPIQLVLGAGTVSLTLALGSPTEIGNRLYLMSPNSDFIHVVPRGLLDSLNRDLEAFLDRRIFSLAAEETRAIQIQDRSASNVRVRLERQEQRWRFVSPIETAADPERVRTLLREWQGLEVTKFEPDLEIPLAMDGSSIRLTLEGLGDRETLILTRPANDADEGLYYLARREAFPAVFRVDQELVTELRSAQENLRERRILANTGSDWTSLKLQFGTLGLTLQQLENGAWQVLYTDSDGQLRTLPASKDTVSDLQRTLQDLEAERFITDAPSEADLVRFGLTEPQRRLTIRAGNRRDLELLVGGLYPGEERTLLYATTDRSDSVFLIRPYILSVLSLDPFAYRERTIRSLPESASIRELVFIHRASGLPQDLPEMEPGETGSDSSPRAALQSIVRSTRVERFLNKPFADPVPLGDGREIAWPYLLEASIQFPSSPEDATEIVRLYLSERLGGTTQYIGDPESGLVGTLSPDLIEQLDPLFADFPEAPVLPPEQPGQAPDQTPEEDSGEELPAP